MVFLIQNSQNRDARTNHLKIDELLRAIAQARTSMVNLQDLSEQELDALEAEFRRLGRSSDTSAPRPEAPPAAPAAGDVAPPNKAILVPPQRS